MLVLLGSFSHVVIFVGVSQLYVRTTGKFWIHIDATSKLHNIFNNLCNVNSDYINSHIIHRPSINSLSEYIMSHIAFVDIFVVFSNTSHLMSSVEVFVGRRVGIRRHRSMDSSYRRNKLIWDWLRLCCWSILSILSDYVNTMLRCFQIDRAQMFRARLIKT